MNAEHLVYWIRGFMERAGVEGYGDACVKAVREHAAVVLAQHPRDQTAMTAHALAPYPAALSAWLDAMTVRVTDVRPDPAETFQAAIERAMAEAKQAHKGRGWPVLFC